MVKKVKIDDPGQLAELVKWALAEEQTLDFLAGGSKADWGRPGTANYLVDLSGFSGITLYEPDELIITVRAGTRLTEIEGLLAENSQGLAFEPPETAGIFRSAPGRQTIGGVIACNLSGPRRLKAGAARDHLLGFDAISGRGESFQAGGKVVKNVTGYDLCKLFCGSFGTLGILGEMTLKVLPAAERTRTLMLQGLPTEDARAALAAAAGGLFEVAGLAHLPAAAAARSSVSYVRDAGAAITAIRLEGSPVSLEYRLTTLREAMAPLADLEELHSHNSTMLWQEIGEAAPLLPNDAALIWKISATPSSGPGIAADIVRHCGGEAIFDWAGGLIWLALPDAGESDPGWAGAVRRALGSEGHATLLRAAAEVRAAVEVFQPQPSALATLQMRVKDSFDPRRILNPGRMYADI